MIDYTKFTNDYTNTRNKGRSLSPSTVAIISVALNELNKRWMWGTTDVDWDNLEAILGLVQFELDQPVTGYSYAFNTSGTNGAVGGSIRDTAPHTWAYDDISLIASDRTIFVKNNTDVQMLVRYYKDGVLVSGLTISPGNQLFMGSLFVGFSNKNGLVEWQQDWMAAPFTSGRIEVLAATTSPTTGQMDINIKWEV